MPFTLSHTAAALPFRRTRLAVSAVVIGSMAPDFEYFLRLTPQDRFGHSLPGLFVFTLPMALAALWLFHRSAKFAVVRLLPTGVQQRIVCDTEFPFGPPRRFALLVLSVLAGAVTHIVWDWFTHRESWLVAHWPLLRRTVAVSWPISRPMPLCIVLQHLSTLGGLVIVALWFLAWFRGTAPTQTIASPLSGAAKLGTAGRLLASALCGALLRTAWFRYASHSSRFRVFEIFVVTAIALLWWELVALGWWWQPRHGVQSTFSSPDTQSLPGDTAAI
jgi:membrane-bound metal-dependent hydrolase YbcI (DUF457 family)